MKEDRAEMKKIMTTLVIEEKKEKKLLKFTRSLILSLFFLRSIFPKHTCDRAKNSYNFCSFNL